MSKKVLVTGATGFLGSYLVRHLIKKGEQVRAIKRTSSKMDLVTEVQQAIEWYEGDILDLPFLEDAMEGIQQVYHCAAMVSFDPRDIKQMMKVNVKGTANVVNAALFTGIDKLLHVSSVAAIGRIKNQKPITEKTKWQRSKYNSNYAISKFLAEQEVWRGQAEGLNVVMINPATVLGSGFWDQSTVRLFQQVLDGLAFYPVGSTGYVDVRDVARMGVQLMEADISGQRFIAMAENRSYRDLFTEVAKVLNKRPPFIRVNLLIRHLAWRFEWLRSRLTNHRPIVTRETALQSARDNVYRNDKSRQILDFDYIPISQTIQEVSQQLLLAQQNNGAPMYLPI
ncbi:MAG: SDR family NAD(P)-dependent oxidoreductase [Bacteroidota bacterium]